MSQKLVLLNDKELVILFKQGNSDAFGTLVERHSKSISFVLMKILKDPMLVEDVLQDTFIKAIEALERKDKEGYADQGNFKAWVTSIGHHLAVDYYRKAKRMNNLNAVSISSTDVFDSEEFHIHVADHEKSPEDEIADSESDYDIQILMDGLPSEQKEVIYLRHFQGFSFREIADFIGDGVSINTLLGRMRYGLINLRRIIEEARTVRQKVS